MLKTICFCIATGFYSGLSPKAPGTVGTLSCLLAVIAMINVTSIGLADLAVFTVLVTIIGTLACSYTLRNHPKCQNNKDPQCIVIDEWAGFLVALTTGLALSGVTATPSYGYLIASFLFFRIFDITKLGPIRRVEGLQGSLGIMADDLLAGLFAGGFVWSGGYFLPQLF